MWVRLRHGKMIDLDGKTKAYHPGDWVNIGRQAALAWLKDGSAELPSQASRQQLDIDLSGCCAVLLGASQGDADRVHSLLRRLAVRYDLAEAAAYKRVCLARPGALARLDLWPAGFDWLDVWEALAPLLPNYETAADLAVEGERTAAVIGDLRVPAYDDRLLFLRQPEGNDLLALWQEERAYGERLALTRALYRAKPLLLALPPTWLAEPEGKYRKGDGR